MIQQLTAESEEKPSRRTLKTVSNKSQAREGTTKALEMINIPTIQLCSDIAVIRTSGG